jgi:uncharacterized membrane protein
VVFSLIVVVAVAGVLIALALAASRRDMFNRAALIALSILATVVALDLIAISTGFHDADGSLDCHAHCTTWQQVVPWTLTVGTLLLVALSVAVILREAWRGRRESR